MNIPKISIVIIGRNEASALPRCLKALEGFKARGGDMVFVDTGSTDGTADIAEKFGMRVFREGSLFNIHITHEEAIAINLKFAAAGEKEIVSDGTELFNFAAARNYATAQAKNDYIVTIDCDEVWTVFDFIEVERLFDSGYTRLSYDYTWSHNPDGSPQYRFISSSRVFNRKELKWTGYVHETLEGNSRQYDPPVTVLKLDHWGRYKESTAKYLATLAYACYREPGNDRNMHYFGRELFFYQRYNSAINVLTKHIAMNGWDQERQQSMIYIGDCLMGLKKEEEAVEMWLKAFNMLGRRREPIMKVVEYYFNKNKLQQASAYAMMALDIPRTGFYGAVEENYTWKPHYYLYLAKWWLGDKEASKYHFDKCLDYDPNNAKVLADAKYYYPDYPGNNIQGWMFFQELRWLYETAKKMGSVLEIGSWKGRSTHALLSARAVVTAIDHFEGSEDPADLSGIMAKKENILEQFIKNTSGLPNLELIQASSLDANIRMPGRKWDMIFIDGAHDYESVKKDILLWRGQARKLICGHDYCPSWPGVVKAVEETIGKPDGVCKSIWYKWL